MNNRAARKVLDLALALPFLICIPGAVIIYRKIWGAVVPVMAITALLFFMMNELDLMATLGGWLFVFMCVQYMSFAVVVGMEAVRRR